jgi:hypothetical protein
MGYNEAALFIALAQLFGSVSGYRLLVEGVEDRLPGKLGMPGNPGQILQLIDYDRIRYVAWRAGAFGNLPGNHAAEIAGVLPVDSVPQVFDHPIIDLPDTAGDGMKQAAAAYHPVKVVH